MSLDLSRYYIIKKFNDGWLMGSMDENDRRFIPKRHLVQLGYLSEPEDPSTPPAISNVIVVPTGGEPPTKSRADLDDNWRSRPSQ